MGQFLVDNNVISNYFSELFSEKAMKFVAEVIDQVPNISVITEIEALSWINADKAKEKIVKDFIQDAKNNAPILRSCVPLRCSPAQQKN